MSAQRRVLRALMQLLVLIDLVFVHMTGAAGLHWLVPLFALTVAAPWLARFREKLVYRTLWNVGVIAFFGVLVRHALRADLAYVLEDGLVLAALCQVHLLNNLRSSQRPDLLFFNAFLIAIVTGFMTTGIGFPVAFLLFAPCFVVGLQLLAATRKDRPLDDAAARALIRDGVARSAVLLAASLLVFFFWPRDFQRKALLQGRFELASSTDGELEIGFTEKLELGKSGPVGTSDAEVLRVTLLEGRSSDVSPLWRGATLGATRGGEWDALPFVVAHHAGSSDESWYRAEGGFARSVGSESTARVRVVRREHGTHRLFGPLGAREVRTTDDSRGVALRANIDATLEASEEAEVSYELALAPTPAEPLGGRRRESLDPSLEPYVQLEHSARVVRAVDLAERLVEDQPDDAPQHLLVARLAEHLSEHFDYVAPGSEGAARTLDEFLQGDRGAHCEYFASALATMLRGLGVPSRVVTGYRSGSWTDGGKTLVFTARSAHAWVEVHDPQAGWYTVDPSPVQMLGPVEPGLWAQLEKRARAAWTAVTGFDSSTRDAALAWVVGLPERLWSACRSDPGTAAASVAALAFVVAWLARRRRNRTPLEVRRLHDAASSARLRLGVGETPRELLRRARRSQVEGRLVRRLEDAVDAHERARYAPRDAA